MLPFEFVATATDSPRDSPGGSLRKLGTVVNGISGTPVIVAFACANAGPAASVTTAQVQARIRLIEPPLSCAEPIPAPPVVQGSMRGTNRSRTRDRRANHGGHGRLRAGRSGVPRRSEAKAGGRGVLRAAPARWRKNGRADPF